MRTFGQFSAAEAPQLKCSVRIKKSFSNLLCLEDRNIWRTDENTTKPLSLNAALTQVFIQKKSECLKFKDESRKCLQVKSNRWEVVKFWWCSSRWSFKGGKVSASDPRSLACVKRWWKQNAVVFKTLPDFSQTQFGFWIQTSALICSSDSPPHSLNLFRTSWISTFLPIMLLKCSWRDSRLAVLLKVVNLSPGFSHLFTCESSRRCFWIIAQVWRLIWKESLIRFRMIIIVRGQSSWWGWTPSGRISTWLHSEQQVTVLEVADFEINGTLDRQSSD